MSGRVQGVAFRWSAREAATRLGVAGWVRNLDDGRVEAWIEGPGDAVDAMLAWCGEGPPAARVTNLDVRPGDAAAYGPGAGFEVRRDSR